MMIREERAAELGALLASLGPSAILKIEMTDPQYISLSAARRSIGPGPTAVSAAILSLVSYSLTMRGEEWWSSFAVHISSRGARDLAEIGESVIEFLSRSPGAAFQREAKIARVRRALAGAREEIERLLADPLSLYGREERLIGALSRALGAKEGSKTIVFAIKMAHYGVGGPELGLMLSKSVPIPVDVRVACSTYASEVAVAPSYRDFVSRPEVAQRAWGMVSELSGIPPLNLDSLLWLTGWAPRDLDMEEAIRATSRVLAAATDRPEEVARRLYLRKCY